MGKYLRSTRLRRCHHQHLQGFVVVIININHNQRHTVAIRVIAALRAAFSVIMEGSNHWPTLCLTHCLTCSHSPTHPPTHAFTHPTTHSPTQILNHPTTHAPTPPPTTVWLTHCLTCEHIHPPNHPTTHSPTQPPATVWLTHWRTHAATHPGGDSVLPAGTQRDRSSSGRWVVSLCRPGDHPRKAVWMSGRVVDRPTGANRLILLESWAPTGPGKRICL